MTTRFIKPGTHVLSVRFFVCRTGSPEAKRRKVRRMSRNRLFNVRLTEEERRMIAELAEAAGYATDSQWLRTTIRTHHAIMVQKSGQAPSHPLGAFPWFNTTPSQGQGQG